jgi:hypothetical protein
MGMSFLYFPATAKDRGSALNLVSRSRRGVVEVIFSMQPAHGLLSLGQGEGVLSLSKAAHQVDDWEIALQQTDGKGGTLGLSSYIFLFRSRRLASGLRFNFFGPGVTIGPRTATAAAALGLSVLEGEYAQMMGPTRDAASFHRLRCRRPVSAQEIHGAKGWLRRTSIGSLSGGRAGSVDSLLTFEASRDGQPLFNEPPGGLRVQENRMLASLGLMYGVWMGGKA